MKEVKEVVKVSTSLSRRDAQTIEATMGNPQSYLGKGEGGTAVETCRGCLDSEGGELKHHQAVQGHLTPQCRGQDILWYRCPAHDGVPPEEYLHRHLCAEGGNPKGTRMHLVVVTQLIWEAREGK